MPDHPIRLNSAKWAPGQEFDHQIKRDKEEGRYATYHIRAKLAFNGPSPMVLSNREGHMEKLGT